MPHCRGPRHVERIQDFVLEKCPLAIERNSPKSLVPLSGP